MKLTDEEREAVRDALELIPTAIKKGLLNSNSATNKLNWADPRDEAHSGSVGRPVSDIDIENKRKAAEILRAAVPGSLRSYATSINPNVFAQKGRADIFRKSLRVKCRRARAPMLCREALRARSAPPARWHGSAGR